MSRLTPKAHGDLYTDSCNSKSMVHLHGSDFRYALASRMPSASQRIARPQRGVYSKTNNLAPGAGTRMALPCQQTAASWWLRRRPLSACAASRCLAPGQGKRRRSWAPCPATRTAFPLPPAAVSGSPWSRRRSLRGWRSDPPPRPPLPPSSPLPRTDAWAMASFRDLSGLYVSIHLISN